MSVSISGLASGLNWQNIISELVAAQEVPETALKTQQTANTNKLTQLTTLESDINNFQACSDVLGADGTFSGRSATFASTGSTWSATAASATPLGQYAFNVTQLATAANLVGKSNVGAPLSSTNDVSRVTVGTMNIHAPVTAGTFSVNGVQINVAATDSLQNVFDNIAMQTAAAGDQVTASYSSANDQVTLKSASGNIVLGSSNDTSNLLSALKLYTPDAGSGTITSQGTLGVTNFTAPVTSANLKTPVSGGGSFEINGVTISYQSTDSLQAILANINTSTAGVVAAYNPSTDGFTLTNSTTGNTALTINSDPNGLLQALGLNSGAATANPGTNAEFTINGGTPLTSTTNTLDASVTGITGLSVTPVGTGSQSLTVGVNNSGATTAINNFISSFNNVQDFISSQTTITNNTDGTVTTSALSGDNDVTDLASTLVNMVFAAVPGLSGTIQRLDNIGIGFTGPSKILSITDQGALTNALSNNPDGVNALFNGTGGLVSQIDSFVSDVTGTNGTLKAGMSALNSENSDLTDQINQMETQIQANKTQMTNEYTAMETALSTLQTEEASLNSMLNSSGTSSSSSSSSSSNAVTNLGNNNVSVS